MFLLNYLINQTREFAHYQYYSSTITFDAQSRTKSKSFEHEIFLYWKFLEKRNLQTERNHSNTKYFLVDRNSNSQFFFMTSKFIRTRNICFSFNLKFTRTRNICFSLWFLHFCLIASKWLEKLLSSWFSHLFFSQWFFDRIVWINRSYCRIFAVETKWLKFRWYYDQNFLWIFALQKSSNCVVLNVDFHMNDLVESNFMWNFVCFLTKNQKIKFIEIFWYASNILYNNSFCCICTFVEKTTKFLVFTFAQSQKKRVIFHEM